MQIRVRIQPRFTFFTVSNSLAFGQNGGGRSRCAGARASQSRQTSAAPHRSHMLIALPSRAIPVGQTAGTVSRRALSSARLAAGSRGELMDADENSIGLALLGNMAARCFALRILALTQRN
jgi:hypothetical protein